MRFELDNKVWMGFRQAEGRQEAIPGAGNSMNKVRRVRRDPELDFPSNWF